MVIGLISYGEEVRTIKVGMILSNNENPFFQEMREGAVERARSAGVLLEVVAAEDSPVKELHEIRRFIEEGVDVLILNPTNSHAVARGVILANEAKIPVITLDRESVRGDVISHIGSNNLNGGKLLARYMVTELGREAKVVEIEGNIDTTASVNRGRGFNQVAMGNLKIIIREDAEFQRDRAYRIMKRLLEEEAVIEGVFAHNDEMALGVIRAIGESRRENIFVVGYDGTEEALKAIKEGKMAATIKQNPYEMGYIGVETAVKVVNKEWVNRKIDIGVYLIDKETLTK